MPMAAVRRSGGYASTRIARLRGAKIAAPTPCRPRLTMSARSLRDIAQPAEKTVKIARPTRKSRLRPYRSPSVPPRSWPAPRPKAIVSAKRPGPRALTAGEAARSRSRKSALQLSRPPSTTNAIRATTPRTTSARSGGAK